jgi:hypothetical protein
VGACGGTHGGACGGASGCDGTHNMLMGGGSDSNLKGGDGRSQVGRSDAGGCRSDGDGVGVEDWRGCHDESRVEVDWASLMQDERVGVSWAGLVCSWAGLGQYDAPGLDLG